jgi:hypothetical protein
LESEWFLDALRLLEALPDWLQSNSLKSAFEACIPEFASGLISLRKVRPKRLHHEDGARAVTFKLVVEDPAGAKIELQLVGVLRPGGRRRRAGRARRHRVRRPRLEVRRPRAGARARGPRRRTRRSPRSPSSPTPCARAALLEAAIRSSAPDYADLHIERCEPKVARFKPGSRCTVVYRLEYPPDADGRGWPERVVAKTRAGEGCRAAYDRLSALWASPLRSSSAVTIAEPLGLVPEPDVMVQRAVPGDSTFLDSLESALFRDTRSRDDLDRLGRWLGASARGLAAFHASGANLPAYGWANELAEVRTRVARLSDWVPGLDAALSAALDGIDGLAGEHPPGGVVTCHGSFRPGQVMLDGDRIAFIDTDGCCAAEPAMDLALFLTSMRTNIIGSGGGEERAAASPAWRSAVLDELDALGDRFLDEYERLAPVARVRVQLWETLYLLQHVLNTWEKIRPEQLAGSEVLLERHLRRSRLLFGRERALRART